APNLKAASTQPGSLSASLRPALPPDWDGSVSLRYTGCSASGFVGQRSPGYYPRCDRASSKRTCFFPQKAKCQKSGEEALLSLQLPKQDAAQGFLSPKRLEVCFALVPVKELQSYHMCQQESIGVKMTRKQVEIKTP
ncbi:hypothetical protein KUCAC02_002240, partial [Chaenocephalus aceratus]